MSRFAAIAVLVALVAAGCASADPTIDASVAEQSATETPLELVSGRDALAAAEGTPHVLWFWAPS